MAIINKTGITNGGTIQAEHVTRVIDALSGVSTDSLIITGSITGSVTGVLNGTASFAITASHALNAPAPTEYITIRLSHEKQTGINDTTTSYFGPKSMSTKSAVNKTGAILPFNCQIISASFYTAVDVIGSGNTSYNIMYDISGTPSTIITGPTLNLGAELDANTISVASSTLSAGDLINIEMIESGTDATVQFTSAVDLFIKKV
jgi:hypothetical protein